MAKPTYSPETKLAVVNHYLSGKDGEERTVSRFGVERTSVRRWIRVRQLHGTEGLSGKNNHHSAEFKPAVARAVISNPLCHLSIHFVKRKYPGYCRQMYSIWNFDALSITRLKAPI